ncbi:hypothetical protein F7725_004500 [Dissostichus mawsoni]|uniref:N-acyl-aromatic-L-amino acid amidohydrolase n=1 Tax=Dissostichus mawsoni TaxID=36200 RepID=A0A7J5XIW7_DISMA|nr:hypothetical protein F7725_004500 [Dissostichus mawsoni]
MEVDELVCLPRLPRVAVCGGTHGNELSGVYLVRELLKMEKKVTKEEEEEEEEEEEDEMSVCRKVMGGGVDAPTVVVMSRDLIVSLSPSGPVSDVAPYEITRALELNRMLGPKGSPAAVDLVCDLHNTTANMGLEMPDVPIRFIHFDVSSKESYSLDSVGKHGFAMEIGPQPHGVVRSNVYTAMRVGVQNMLDWVRFFNSGVSMVKHIDYPRDRETRTITAAIHPQLQDRDFCLLHPGDPLFQTFSGETLPYKGKEPLYPFFINECAYYEKGIALSLARKRRVMIPSIRVQTEQEQESYVQEITSEKRNEDGLFKSSAMMRMM